MKIVTNYFRELYAAATSGWDRFWFSARSPETFCLIRIFAGAMLFYTHLVWSADFAGFFGPRGRLSVDFVRSLHLASGDTNGFAWSHLFWFESQVVLWAIHWLALLALLMFTIGFACRVTSVLAFLIAVSYVHRANGALFGLDQINVFLAMYLMLGPSGECFSVDRWLRSRASRARGSHSQLPVRSFVSTNVATRLIQIHLCVVYFFAGAGKLAGETWWNGEALWGAFANLEYQTIDMTWIAGSLVLVNFLSQFSVAWELTYSVFVWNRLLRPIVVGLAIPLHLGIALCMGMITFGLIMLVANMAFVSPELIRTLVPRKAA